MKFHSPENEDLTSRSAASLELGSNQISSPLNTDRLTEQNQFSMNFQSATNAGKLMLPNLELNRPEKDWRAELPPALQMLFGDPSVQAETASVNRVADQSTNIATISVSPWSSFIPSDLQAVTTDSTNTTAAESPAAWILNSLPQAQDSNRTNQLGDRPSAVTDTPSTAAPDTSPTALRFDAAGFATDINYPDGKMRHIERDPQTHEAMSIFTKNSEGITKLVNQSGTWFLDVQGMQLPFPGKVEVSKNGDISMQTSQTGVWRIEKPDGKTSEEKENADGARVSYDDNHNIAKITRQDGTTYVQQDSNTIVETHPGSTPRIWTSKDGLWSSDGNNDKPRKNMELHDDASVVFTDNSGIKHTVNGRGLETLEGAGLGKIIPDASGRPQEVDTADGKKVRKYEYFDDKSSDIKSVTIIDKDSNSQLVYTRDNKDSKQWRSDKGQIWNGEIRVSPDGVHSIRTSNSYQYYDDSLKDNTKWTSYYPDGRQTTDTINADGSRASYDQQNNLVSFRGPDGVRIDRLSVNGKDTVNYYDPKVGETINWTKASDGNWSSDSARIKDVRKDLSFNTNGELSYTNDAGGKVQEHRDGTKQVTEKDGTRLDFDKDNQIIKATKGNLERTFIRDGSGIAVVKDLNLSTKESRTIFERRPPGEENRTNIFVTPNGDLSYQNPDGSAVLERSNMLHIDLDHDGDMTRVIGPHATRTFQYIGDGEHKTVVSVTDTKMTDKGGKAETWTRVANPDGTLSNEFRSVDDKGKERKSRYDLTPCADGELEYRLATDKPGDKPHVAKLGGDSGEGGFSDSVDEAKDRLTEAMESHLDEPRKARFAAMLASFEDRAKQRVEAETAGGKSQEAAQAEWDQKVSHTYDYLAHMLDEGAQNTTYDLNTRAKLVEDAVYSMAWPAKADDQGNWGCCWQISGVFLGVIQDPDKMAKMLDQLSMTGQFTDTNGKTWTPPSSLLQFSSQGSNWTIENCGNGGRSPCSEIWTSVAAYLSNDGRRTDRGSGGGTMQGSMHSMKLITGDTWRDTTQGAMTGSRYKQDLLLKGGVILDLPGHMYLGTLQKNRGEWQIISSLQHGDSGRQVNGVVKDLKDWVVNRSRSRYTPDIPKVAVNDSPIGNHSIPRRRNNNNNSNRWS